uniref:rRNA-processing protein EBP2 n=1 Tax=Favella ehrenbergii TaxID=182087 RepID=A0A7S3MN52_9SPIT|mmetsp:Transcript_31289/g.41398  ORF Transcript_31289/g.41398 Transcript_31289/m.41398 type:complete len:255 (-) Transcript_31289:111-875(-)
MNFYNRLDSKRLVKKQGKIPFTEHMTVTGEEPINIPEALEVSNEIKREVAFYNATRANVMKGMQFLVQSKCPISRPDDFFAEMLKSDGHMAKVKARLLKQQTKIKSFEEKKQRTENKKFHKALKDFKMKSKHAEKRENLDQIKQLKQKIRERGDDMADADFDKFVQGKTPSQKGRKGAPRTIDTVRDSERERQRKKNEFKASIGGKGKGGAKGGKGGKGQGKGMKGRGGKGKGSSRGGSRGGGSRGGRKGGKRR